MSANSSIEWTDRTWNPVVGCRAYSSGCANCYAETMSVRLAGMARKDIADGKNPGRKRAYLNVIDDGGWKGNAQTVPDALTDPLSWKKPHRVFVNSMSDLFYGDDADRRACESKGIAFEPIPFEFVDKVFAVMALCPQHTFQILTKRTARMAEYFTEKYQIPASHTTTGKIEWEDRESRIKTCDGPAQRFLTDHTDDEQYWTKDGSSILTESQWPLPNVWLGTSVENQKCADERIPHLLKCPAAVRFLSCEPLLGPLDLTRTPYMSSGALHRMNCLDGYGGWDLPRWNHKVDWVIVGGESGPNARDFVVEYGGDILRQCSEAGVAAFLKQMGSRPVTTNVNLYDWPDEAKFLHWGSAAASARIKLKDSHGGDPSEWPESLRVREFPSLRKGPEVGK